MKTPYWSSMASHTLYRRLRKSMICLGLRAPHHTHVCAGQHAVQRKGTLLQPHAHGHLGSAGRCAAAVVGREGMQHWWSVRSEHGTHLHCWLMAVKPLMSMKSTVASRAISVCSTCADPGISGRVYVEPMFVTQQNTSSSLLEYFEQKMCLAYFPNAIYTWSLMCCLFWPLFRLAF